MSEKSNKVLHLWAIRMNWLLWLGRPVVALWGIIASFFHYMWKIIVISWKAMLSILNYRYWLLGGIGLSVAIFVVFLSYSLSIVLKLPWLFFLGLIFSILPIAWSFGEVAALIKKRDDTGEFIKIREAFWFSGSGFITAGIMFKYVIIASVFVILQMLLSMGGLIPEAGSLVYGVFLIPIILLSVIALLCGIVISFGLAVFPGYVLFSYKDQGGGFFKNLKIELKTILEIIKTKWFKILLSNIPAAIFSIIISIIPVLLLVSGGYITYMLNTDMGYLSPSFKGMSVLLMGTLKNLQLSDLSLLSVISTLISGISFSILAGLALGGAIATFGSIYFHIYKQNLSASLYELSKFQKEDQDLDSDVFMDLPGESNNSDDEVLSVDDLGDPNLLLAPGILSGSKNDGDYNSTNSNQNAAVDKTDESFKDESVVIEKSEDDIISGDDVLASLESTMTIEEIPESNADVSVSEAPQRENEDIINTEPAEPINVEKSEDDIISGDDILASLENTMAIDDLPDDTTQSSSSGGSDITADLPPDTSVPADTQADVSGFDSGMETKNQDESVSGDDSASLENTMDAEGLPESPQVPVSPASDTSVSEEGSPAETGLEASTQTDQSDLMLDDDLLNSLDLSSAPETVSETSEPDAAVVSESVTAEDGTYFSDKGQAGSSSFLVSVKDNNQIYFGIKAPAAGSYNFILTLFFENGQSTTEFITIDSIDEKGMGYDKRDFSKFLTQDGYGKIQKVEVTPA
ncbi:MAG: hypothetical protein KAS64_07820 [Spirochaetes bacterium]|nr:hypothetical protein [Spirochaetota bacterium]